MSLVSKFPGLPSQGSIKINIPNYNVAQEIDQQNKKIARIQKRRRNRSKAAAAARQAAILAQQAQHDQDLEVLNAALGSASAAGSPGDQA